MARTGAAMAPALAVRLRADGVTPGARSAAGVATGRPQGPVRLAQGPIGPLSVARMRHDAARKRPAPGASRAPRSGSRASASVRGAELLQGGETRIGSGVRDLRRRGPGRAGRAAPSLRRARLALRGPSLARVPDEPRRARPRRLPLARLALLGLLHQGPVAGALHPRPPAYRSAAAAGAPRVLLLGGPSGRGRGGVRCRGAARARHRVPPPSGRGERRGPRALGPHDAPLVPGGPLAPARRRAAATAAPAATAAIAATARAPSLSALARPPGRAGTAFAPAHRCSRRSSRRRGEPGGRG